MDKSWGCLERSYDIDGASLGNVFIDLKTFMAHLKNIKITHSAFYVIVMVTLFKVSPLIFLLALSEMNIASITNAKNKEDTGHPCLIPLEVTKASLAYPLLAVIQK